MTLKAKLMGGVSAMLTVSLVALVAVLTLEAERPSRVYAQQTADARAARERLIIGAEQLSDAFRAAAKSLKPSVVTITALVDQPRMRMSGSLRGLPPGVRELFPDIFEDERFYAPGDRGQADEPGAESEKIQAGIGSGVIVSEDGFILTNNHVVARADELQVELSDGRTYSAEIVGTDEASDVAVLKIEARNLVPAELGDSSAIEVGDWVIAVGSPFGLDQTVTAGIISATNRQTGILSGGFEDFLQTDAAINPGNSGGPLVNLRGEVVGINTAINSRTGTNAGVGFAIPSNMAARIMQDLRDGGRVVRGFIGATLGQVTFENAREFQLPENIQRGTYIESLLKEGPADRAGLRPGDVVMGVNGRRVNSVAQLRNMVAMTRPGKGLNLEIFRNGRAMQLKLVVEERTEAKLNELAGRTDISSLGISIEPLTPAVAEQLGYDSGADGVVVTRMDRRGVGARVGLRPGDIIVEVNGEEIEKPADVVAALNAADGLNMIIQRQNQLIRLSVNSR